MMRAKLKDLTLAFEMALAKGPKDERYFLKLFITGTTPKCARAIQNIRAICEEHLAGCYDLEVVDIYQNPDQAAPEQVFVTPTLVKKHPLPLRKLVGDLSDRVKVMDGLDLTKRATLRKLKKDEHDS